jgi:hypothetical protein
MIPQHWIFLETLLQAALQAQDWICNISTIMIILVILATIAGPTITAINVHKITTAPTIVTSTA